MLDDNSNNQFINGQNSLTGKSQLGAALSGLTSGGGGDVSNPMSNDLSAGGFTIMNMRDPIDLGDAVNLNYFNANIGATPSSIVNNLNLSSKLTANQTEILCGNTPLNMNSQVIKNVANPVLQSDAVNKGFLTANTLSNTSNLNFISTNNPTTASWSNYNYKIVDIADPNLAQDCATKNYVDTALSGISSQSIQNVAPNVGFSKVNCVNQNIIDLSVGNSTRMSLDLAGNSITGGLNFQGGLPSNLGTPIINSDATNKFYVDQQVGIKISEAQGNLLYYPNTTTLNNITLATGTLDINNQKITNLSPGSTTTDGYQYGQAQTALALKSDRTQSLESLNVQAPLTSNLDLNTGFKTLVKTADETNVKEVINKEYFDAHLFQTEHLYWISNNVIPVTATQIIGFVVKEQQPTSGSVNIVIGADQVTLKGGFAYNIFVRPFFTGNNNNSNIKMQLWSGGTILDSTYPSAVELNSFPSTSNSQTIQNASINYTFKPVLDTVIIIQCINATGILIPCDIEWSIRQMPVNYTVISQIAQTTPNEYIELASNTAQPTVNINLLDNFYNGYKNTIKAVNNIVYNGNGTITLKSGSYQYSLNCFMLVPVGQSTVVYQLWNTATNTELLQSLGYSINANLGQLSTQTYANTAQGQSCLQHTFTTNSEITIALRCSLNTGGQNILRTWFSIQTIIPFSSAVNTSQNFTINSDINMGATYKMLQQTIPTGPYDLINKNYGDTTYLQTNTPLNQISIPNASVSMNNQKITNLSPATLASDAVRFDQLSDGAVQNPMINGLNAGGFKISNMGNGTLSGDSVNLGQSQAFNNGYLSQQIYNPLNNTDKLWFSNNKLIWEDSIQNTSTNPYVFLTKNGTSTIFIPDSSFLQDGAIEFQSDNINSPVLTLNKTQAKTIFSNYPVEIRNNTTVPSSGSGGTLLRVGQPYSGGFSATFDGDIQANGITIPTPCSKEWKDNIQEQTGLEWIDNMKIYSFDYSDKKLKKAGIDPQCIQQKHIDNGYLMEEIDPEYYLKTNKLSSWGGNDIINRPIIDQLILSRCHQRIQQQQQQINDLMSRVLALETAGKVLQLNNNPFQIDQLSEDDEPVILDRQDIKSKSLFKSIF